MQDNDTKLNQIDNKVTAVFSTVVNLKNDLQQNNTTEAEQEAEAVAELQTKELIEAAEKLEKRLETSTIDEIQSEVDQALAKLAAQIDEEIQ